MKRILLDTNVIIHRETNYPIKDTIGDFFRYLNEQEYELFYHAITKTEFEKIESEKHRDSIQKKLRAYNLLPFQSELDTHVIAVCNSIDQDQNDKNDTRLLNEVYLEKVDFLISEDKTIHRKAKGLKIQEKVFTIERFADILFKNIPQLTQYRLVDIEPRYFGEINLKDSFFDTLREDYCEFDIWFKRKSTERAYVLQIKNKIRGFLYLKVEDEKENYPDFTTTFSPIKRLKIGTFKTNLFGVNLGERFLKIAFDNAMHNSVSEIYLTAYDKTLTQQMMINEITKWGFIEKGVNNSTGEKVFVRDFSPDFNEEDPRKTYPYIMNTDRVHFVQIFPEYHTKLLPESILKNENPHDFNKPQSHSNSIEKVFISRSINKDIKKGDILVFRRTGDGKAPAKYRSVVTTVGLTLSVNLNCVTFKQFKKSAFQRSVFSEKELKEMWDRNQHSRPFLVNFLNIYSFPKKMTLNDLLELDIVKDLKNPPRGISSIGNTSFKKILKRTNADESFIIY
ncbi:MAG: hypothetical protein K8S56_10410 [Candidatus Cloacimonetes bacterium]|nr:hypothetical protein [Candidatus Cloacimonadota bacterium]